MNQAAGIITTALLVEHRTATGTVRALTHPGLVVESGTSVALMGPSGCGKSTLLGLLAGLSLPTSGSVTIGETEISALPERARVRYRREHLGMVYQTDNLLPHLTVEENVAISLAIGGCTGDRGPVDVVRVLERLGLGALRTRFPDQLSGGQRQRAAVARAVVHGPSVILADEPTGALDPVNARAVIELLVDVHQASGATLILVTHDPTVAEHADRIELLDRPARTPALADAG